MACFGRLKMGSMPCASMTYRYETLGGHVKVLLFSSLLLLKPFVLVLGMECSLGRGLWERSSAARARTRIDAWTTCRTASTTS